ncbi:hypothetical protein CCACVL1_14268 [Corchorus capsularis]|uniref:Midasin n=1 Tax=Corchorus capsularis TaxID=210143 RepID=A0A1R3I7S3_COCAP|nr:hypothetical protein CCACVL1_14268 [Corchorus capsularis]
MVEVMKELQLHRQSSKVFAGKHGFITPRDLFRWADRFRISGTTIEDLARDGYHLLAERLRVEDEKCVVQAVLERHLRVKLDDLYKPPVLLVGETGGGKTTVCQLLSFALGLNLHILNCHQYTETSDFLGGFYPIRDRSRLSSEYKSVTERLKLLKALTHFPQYLDISSDISHASTTLDRLDLFVNKYRQGLLSHPEVTLQDIDTLEEVKQELTLFHRQWQSMFTWQDGPLVQSMKAGDLFLVDEISLADDSVLERLNSVLEPERKLSLAEKGGDVLERVTAHENFLVLATMNPGGDYGKKELSPALRNRFTEIWVPSVGDLSELRSIASYRLLRLELSHIVNPMVNFYEWFNQLQVGRFLTVRDLLSWIEFVDVSKLGPEHAFLHGAFLVLLDGLSLGTGLSKKDCGELRERCLSFLLELLQVTCTNFLYPELSKLENYGWGDPETPVDHNANSMPCDNIFGIDPFYIETGSEKSEAGGFEFLAPTTRKNALRVLRAMQLSKPVLLEGSPGVGKTSLIVALGKFSGHRVVRINLSEQTDMMDLLGSDLPVESNEGVKFAWSDGILLQALKEGCWVLLDELNLAPQSVLEGLNAILDHRAEVFIPELGRTYRCPSSFRVFSCQNPSYQGGGRKGLPKSFLNRFTKVYIDELVEEDYLFICSSLYPSIPRHLLSNLISFNRRLHEETMLYHKFAQNGSPWEFNLRDVLRSCQILQGTSGQVDSFLNLIYIQRMRTAADRRQVMQLYEQIFGVKPSVNPFPRLQVNSEYLIVGSVAVKRNFMRPSRIYSELKVLPSVLCNLEAAAHCVQRGWLCILIGPPLSGKTSLIRLLAQLTGNILHELNLSSASDISELLGCFEQYNALRNFRSVVAQVDHVLNEYNSLLLETSMETFLTDRKDLIAGWLAFISDVNSDLMPSFSSICSETWKSISKYFPSLIGIIEQLKSDLEKHVLPISWTSEDLDRTMKTILKLQDHQRRPFSAKFEWITGLLIKAIENGEWIVLENANLCNPTVLDRINSLVEPDGTITVNECGVVDGKPVVLHPHSNFRMFLTVNPSFGEVSRAMRNRGVEIFMMEPYWIFDEGSGYNSEELEMKDVQRFLVLAGIPGAKLVESMAKAHVYAMVEGARLNVRITYLELARWVQLFHHLLINGNQPLWSLEISWEHTYLSSLGEAEGVNIVKHAKNAYFSVTELYRSEYSALGIALCLPGGWPMPLTLRGLAWYSKDAYVKQNCSYLGFLGAQYASHQLAISSGVYSVEEVLLRSDSKGTYLLDWKMLYRIAYPQVSEGMISDSDGKTEFNVNIVNKMMFFAANWVVEQATENDFQLYLQWFSWLSFQLEPYGQFFKSFLTLLEQERMHPIWTYIIQCRQELILLNQLDLDLHPIPMLSSELVDLTSLNHSNTSSKLLHNAIHSVSLVRLSYRQWNVESSHNFSDESRCFIPFLESLRALEEEILHMLVGSPSFDTLYQLYSNLVEDHILFWEGLVLWQLERLLISWRFLLKDAGKLKDFCPLAVNMLVSKNLAEHSLLRLQSERSLLWVHGGHPFMPPSSKLYHQQRQLLKLCELVWPTKRRFSKTVNEFPLDMVASFDPEFRFLALEGICMSSFIMTNGDEDEIKVSHQVEEVYQMLSKKFEHEKCKSLNKHGSDNATYEENLAACCILSSGMLHTRSGFDSWLDILPIVDCASCFLDMELLQELSLLLLADSEELKRGLVGISSLLESDLKYSLTHSSRPPQSFVPHQKLLWLVDAWTSVHGVHRKVSGFVLEMWFWWHSTLWSQYPASVENFSIVDGYDVPLPYLLIHPVITESVAKILQSTPDIKDFSMHGLKLKAASCVIWQISSPGTNANSFLLSSARSVFQQIIYSHRKSFDAEKFASIKSILHSSPNCLTEKSLGDVSLLIESSRHGRLKSLTPSLIEPLLRQLYLNCSTESYLNLGFAWLYIGGLRFHLLLSCDSLDPASKYSCKLSCLEEKIVSHKLELNVRQECNYLSGWSSSKESDNRIFQALEKLEIEHRKLQRKIVFRPDPGKFKALRKECDEFLVLVNSLISLVNKSEAMELQLVVDKVCNWQETASCFIDRLLNEYPEFIDVAQPIQVAVYEMKLGLSLVVSSALQKRILDKIQEDNMDRVMEFVYSFIRFPRCCSSKLVSISDGGSPNMFSSLDIPCITNFSEMELALLGKIATISSGVDAEKVSVLQLKASVYNNVLVRVAHSVATAKLMDNESFTVLDKIFSEFAHIWMHMKIQGKNQEDSDGQHYKFRARVFRIENVMEVDISALGKFLANESFIEWKELLSEEESTETIEDREKHENLEDEWSLMEESILINMINMHNQLFGSIDLVLSPGSFQITDMDRLHSFIGSYTLGVAMIKGFGGLFSSALDAKLVQEHLLRLCWEYEEKLPSSRKADHKYNFYKDSNTQIMAKMVELLTTLKQRVLTLLSEWEDHPGLQKVLELIEMLLAIPLSTPLAKALSGLQFLLNRMRMLQETGSKFSLSDQLDPLLSLVCSWQKMEFDSWPVLLDEVQDQYDINAAKLWFPLFSVLCSSEIAGDDQIQLEEFIQTSSIGEFRKRLQLLFAFLGQMMTGRRLEIYCVVEFVEANRRNIETELKEVLKLCRWDRFESQLSLDSLRKPRQKTRKLIQKYSDILQQPVMLILNEEVGQKGFKVVSPETPKPLNDTSESIKMLNAVLNLTQSLWYTNWVKEVNDTLQNLHFERIADHQCLFSGFACLSYSDEWRDVGHTLEKIGRVTMDCGNLWMDVNRNRGKKRALSELLKLLESSGLERHKFEIMKLSKPTSWLFRQPAYDVQHLLMERTRLPNGVANVASSVENCLPKENLDTDWKIANEFYFKSLAAVQLLQQISLEHHQDFTPEQVSRSVSYLIHLVIVQQMQREAVYDFARQTKTLCKYAKALESSYSCCIDLENTSGTCLFAKSQHATFICMWQQKRLFDDMDAMLVEESLLLRTVESTHFNSCQKVKASANRILSFIEEFIPVVKKSKESLDSYFIGCDGSITTLVGTIHPCVITEQMEQVVRHNFQVLQECEEQLAAFNKQDFEKSSIVDSILSHFDERFSKGKEIANQLNIASESKSLHELANSCCERCSQLEAQFGDAFRESFRHVTDVLQKLGSLSNQGCQPEASLGSITEWESLFKSYNMNFGVDELCKKLLKTIHSAENLINHSGITVSSLCFQIGALLKCIHASVDLILSFSNRFLEDFLAMHKTVSILTYGLANILAALYAKGFGVSTKDQEDDTSHDTSQNASGTGMGEGAGVNDPSEEQAASDDVPSKDQKGIEMEQDFAADTFSVSEDSGDENDEDTEDQQLESAMGETGDNSEVVDEKLWDKDNDENPNNNEKYESGPSVRDNDTSSREFRAKEDSAGTADEPEESKMDDLDKNASEIENEADLVENENTEDPSLNKEEGFADPTGLEPDKLNQSSSEDINLDQNEENDIEEENGPDEEQESAKDGNDEGCSNPADETMEEMESERNDGTSEKDERVDATTEKDDPDRHHEDSGINQMASRENDSGSNADNIPNGGAAMQSNSVPLEVRNVAPEANWSNRSDIYNDLAPQRNFPSTNDSDLSIMVADSSNGGKLADNHPKTEFPRLDAAPQKKQANPYRNVGDALQEWKERVSISVDLQDDNKEPQGEIEDENANEFGYVSEFEKGTAQALGPATAEQIDADVNVNKPEENPLGEDGNDVADMEIDEQNSEEYYSKHYSSVTKNKMYGQIQASELEESMDHQSPEARNQDGCGPGILSESLVSVRKSYLSEDVYQLKELSINEEEMGKALDLEEVSGDVKNNATALWRRYELQTTRLSQELAEQLRLVMEPTLASKLQGDYKTGKRINMKKVIPYIASHYRKDKIWLRRTRRNKRNYQVIIAVDDSHSMSESGCGEVAIKALVTVCRAMSQLEVGNLAVASFGKKGNIRLLHDFDQPFTGESGVKMISSLTFKQENTITDEPVVDLLMFLNKKLDGAVSNARLPSGQNPLQQLVLIIGDGRLHEKENLKRCVRDVLSSKRMVAFLILDSMQESIMDLQVIPIQDKNNQFKISVSKYLDSFPFPYYVVLRNIEALPNTLADLLRQWFELMQNSRE